MKQTQERALTYFEEANFKTQLNELYDRIP